MTRCAMRWFAWMALWGCTNGGGATETPSAQLGEGDWVDINDDGFVDGVALDTDGDGVVDSVDLDGDGTPDARLPGNKLPDVTPDAAVAPVDAGDAPGENPSDERDGGGTGPKPLPVIEIPTARVPCGASDCEIRDNHVCCDYWTSSGFGNVPMCLTEDACVLTDPTRFTDPEGLYGASLLDAKRAVVSRCDGAEDCSVGHVCCYVRYGAPIPEADLSTWVGPGAGRQCMSVEDCTAVGAANGVPTGLVSCNDDRDCGKLPGTTCQPEQTDSASTGKNVKAREGFMVCR